MEENKNLVTLEEFIEKNYGKRGTKERDEFEAGYEAFKIDALVRDRFVDVVMAEEQLVEKENDTKPN